MQIRLYNSKKTQNELKNYKRGLTLALIDHLYVINKSNQISVFVTKNF